MLYTLECLHSLNPVKLSHLLDITSAFIRNVCHISWKFSSFAGYSFPLTKYRIKRSIVDSNSKAMSHGLLWAARNIAIFSASPLMASSMTGLPHKASKLHRVKSFWILKCILGSVWHIPRKERKTIKTWTALSMNYG